MKTILKKTYTLLPLVMVVFFFQNCGSENKLSAGVNSNVVYEGISNINNANFSN